MAGRAVYRKFAGKYGAAKAKSYLYGNAGADIGRELNPHLYVPHQASSEYKQWGKDVLKAHKDGKLSLTWAFKNDNPSLDVINDKLRSIGKSFSPFRMSQRYNKGGDDRKAVLRELSELNRIAKGI